MVPRLGLEGARSGKPVPASGSYSESALSTVLTAVCAAIQYLMVPPGEAGHLFSNLSTVAVDHERTRHVAPAADLCAGRPRLRAGRGRLADRDQRRALSRLHVGG